MPTEPEKKRPEDMTDDDLEFLRACDTYRQKVRFMAVTDYLSVLKSLGWKRDRLSESA